jgi:hypothetical protein
MLETIIKEGICMASPKENFLRLMKNDNPKWVGDPWSCFPVNPIFRPITFDAITSNLNGPKRGEKGIRNRLGVIFDWPADQPGSTPNNHGDNKLVKDITQWKDFVQLPDMSWVSWDEVDQFLATVDRDKYLVMAPSFTGMFEYSHYVLGFQDALVNYLMEPEHMFDMLSAFTDWKIKNVGLVIDHMKPDIIHSHDDWGNKRSLFLNPSTWREMIKPHYERFYGYIKSRGVLIQHHADCVSHEVAEDMVDLGIDMWQGVIPQNDIKGVIERTEGKLCIMGGFDMQLIDFPDTPEEKIRNYVHEVIDTYMPLGSFMPCVTNIIPVHKNVEQVINDEMDKSGAIYAAEHFN